MSKELWLTMIENTEHRTTLLTLKRFALAAGLFVVAALAALAPVGVFAARGEKIYTI